MEVYRKNIIFYFYVVVLLTTEFYYIEIWGGTLRIYHFASIFIVVLLSKYFFELFRSPVFINLFLFFLVNLLAALYANDPFDSFKSLGLLVLNISICVATALIIISRKMKVRHFVYISIAVGVLGVFVGVSQILIYKFFGINLGFSESQAGQIAAGFSSGFRTEANTFAKYLNCVFLLGFPSFINRENTSRAIPLLGLLTIGMFLSFTRSALYGLSATLTISYIIYVLSRKGKVVSRKVLFMMSVGLLCFILYAANSSQFNLYATHKIETFFNLKEIFHGESSGFRLMSQGVLWDSFVKNYKTIFLGNGWGQVRFFDLGREWQAGAAEIITALGYGGIFSGLFFFSFQVAAIFSTFKFLQMNKNSPEFRCYEGVFLSLIGLFVTGYINGSLNAPEYWMIYGLGIGINVSMKFNKCKKHIFFRGGTQNPAF